jgi:cytochrome c biogenesis protein CcmG/thiol:disulfide interchange protein DsbE
VRKAGVSLSFLILILVIAFIAISSRAKNPSTQVTVETPLLGKPAPAFNGIDLFNDKSITLNSFQGKYLVINFFASWCQPCRQEAPNLLEFYTKYKNEVSILSIGFDDTASSESAFLKTNAETWPAINDTSGQIAVSYGVSEPPETFFISPSGFILVKFVGPVTFAGLQKALVDGQKA